MTLKQNKTTEQVALSMGAVNPGNLYSDGSFGMLKN